MSFNHSADQEAWKQRLYELGKREAMKRQPIHFPEFFQEEEKEKFSQLPEFTQNALNRKNKKERMPNVYV